MPEIVESLGFISVVTGHPTFRFHSGGASEIFVCETSPKAQPKQGKDDTETNKREKTKKRLKMMEELRTSGSVGVCPFKLVFRNRIKKESPSEEGSPPKVEK